MTDILSLVPESHQHLLTDPHFGAFVTIDAKGRPQTTAIGFGIDDDGELKSSVDASRQKYKNAVKNPNVGLLIIDPANPMRTLELRATAEIEPDPDFRFLAKFCTKAGIPLDSILETGRDRYVIVFKPWRVVTNG